MEQLILNSKLTSDQQNFLVNLCNDFEMVAEDWRFYDNSVTTDDLKTSVEARGRKYLTLNDLDEDVQSVLDDIKNNIFIVDNFDKSKFKLIENHDVEGTYPTMLSCIHNVDNIPGHGIHTHKDYRGPNDEMQVRFNYLVRKPEEGGEPVINRRVIDLQEKQGMVLFASEWLHSGLPVKGDRMRVLLSIGYLVENKYAQELEKRFNYGRI